MQPARLSVVRDSRRRLTCAPSCEGGHARDMLELKSRNARFYETRRALRGPLNGESFRDCIQTESQKSQDQRLYLEVSVPLRARFPSDALQKAATRNAFWFLPYFEFYNTAQPTRSSTCRLRTASRAQIVAAVMLHHPSV